MYGLKLQNSFELQMNKNSVVSSPKKMQSSHSELKMIHYQKLSKPKKTFFVEYYLTSIRKKTSLTFFTYLPNMFVSKTSATISTRM